MTQGLLAKDSGVSQGYLSQLENGEVQNPSANILLRLSKALGIKADSLFEAAGYPTTGLMRKQYTEDEKLVLPELLDFLSELPKENQQKLLRLLEGVELLMSETPSAVSL